MVGVGVVSVAVDRALPGVNVFLRSPQLLALTKPAAKISASSFSWSGLRVAIREIVVEVGVEVGRC